MKFIADLGNTLLKFAVFHNKECIDTLVLEKFDQTLLKSFMLKHDLIESCIISSVIDNDVELRQLLSETYHTIELSEKTAIPLKNHYKTPDSLGKDRLAAACGGNSVFKNSNILVIQAGTCITYEFVNEHNEYKGGSISPGLNMRFAALNTFTGKLPLIGQNEKDCLTGQTTEEAILSGVQRGIVAEVDGIIECYKQEYSNLTIILSGGDMNFFGKRLKNSIFALPNIVLTGLNEILDFNVEDKERN